MIATYTNNCMNEGTISELEDQNLRLKEDNFGIRDRRILLVWVVGHSKK